MAAIKWRVKGKWLKNCNCDPGCPCDFWAKPTHTGCEGMFAMHIDEGQYGRTSLKGARFAAQYRWPGPLHEGNGTVQAILDDRTTEAQREALLTILNGKAGNPWFEVVMSLISTVLTPRIARIDFRFDLKKRRARVVIPGILETTTEPVKNIATGAAYRVDVVLPDGMEYKRAAIGQAVVNRATGAIAYDWPGGHSSLALVEQTQAGLRQ
jgi:hypothetical protein